MFCEAAQAGDAVDRQLARNSDVLSQVVCSFGNDRPALFLTCGRGSSGHAASFFRHIVQAQLEILASPFDPSVASVLSKSPPIQNGVGLVISQSGQSPDIVAFARRYREAGNRIIAIVNEPRSPLALAADFVVPVHAGKELSIAATKSYLASMFAALQVVAVQPDARITPADLDIVPGLLRRAWELDWSVFERGVKTARGMFVIGRGVGLGAAGEAALKLKETCLIQAEAFSAAEVRHGPMALLSEGFPVLIFRQEDETSMSVDAFANLAVAKGCKVFVTGKEISGATCLPCLDAPALIQPLLQVQTFYRAANAIAVARGRDPDCPANLEKITETT